MTLVKEGLEMPSKDKYVKVNSVLREIICANTCLCSLD
jgi:hypothetical protein